MNLLDQQREQASQFLSLDSREDWVKRFGLRKVTIYTILNLTSWANARVKLHSQVHFGSKNILGQKKFEFQKILGPQIF